MIINLKKDINKKDFEQLRNKLSMNKLQKEYKQPDLKASDIKVVEIKEQKEEINEAIKENKSKITEELAEYSLNSSIYSEPYRYVEKATVGLQCGSQIQKDKGIQTDFIQSNFHNEEIKRPSRFKNSSFKINKNCSKNSSSSLSQNKDLDQFVKRKTILRDNEEDKRASIRLGTVDSNTEQIYK